MKQCELAPSRNIMRKRDRRSRGQGVSLGSTGHPESVCGHAWEELSKRKKMQLRKGNSKSKVSEEGGEQR